MEMNLTGITMDLLLLTEIALMPLEGSMQAGAAHRNQEMMLTNLLHIARDLPG